VLSSIGITYVLSEKYRASLTVLYQPREDITFQSKAREALGFPLPLVPLETIANTLEDIVTGDAVLEQTVRELHLDVKPERVASVGLMGKVADLKDWFKETRENTWQVLKYGRVLPRDPFRSAVGTLRANLSLKRVNKAYTFRLEVLNEDPKRAAKIVETVGALLADAVANQKSHAGRENRKNIEARRQLAEHEVAALRYRLQALKVNTGISSLDEELSLRLKSLNTFEEELSRDRTQLRSLEERRAALESQLGGQKPTEKYETTMAENPVFGHLRMEKAQLEIERAGMLEKFTQQNKDVKAVDAKLAETDARLTNEKPEVLHSESTRTNDLHQKLESDLLSVRADIEAAKAKEVALQDTLQNETAVTRRMVKSEPTIEQAILQLSAAEASFKLINEAYEEARLSESRTLSEIMVPNPATIPFEPVRPIRILHVGVTLLLALALAIGLSLSAHFFDSTVYDEMDAERALGFPVLAAIPSSKDLQWSES
jgi:uncharacterized protein involved in exopolysaccharide biosynthesis